MNSTGFLREIDERNTVPSRLRDREQLRTSRFY
jgi:hypothetical protein